MITRIGRRRTFDELRRGGRRVRHGSVRLIFLPQNTAEIQLAFALGRSFGNAVERNRGRRRLRAAFTEAVRNVHADHGSASAEPGIESRTELRPEFQGAFLLTGSRGLLTDDFAKMVGDVEACLTKLTPMKCETS